MAPKTETKTDAIRLMSTETNFERSGISGQNCRPDAAPRQEEMPAEVHKELLAAIGRDEIVYIVFSYRTPIAWVHRNGAVNLPEIKYSRSTTMHQNWVREAFGDRVNRPGDWTAAQADAPVVLSENEEIILRRMRDEDGTEYRLVTGPTSPLANQKLAPRDQVEPLGIKGLVEFESPTVARLTDKGRAHLDQIQPVVPQENALDLATLQNEARKYAELSEDDLIDMLAGMAETFAGHLKGIPADMAALSLALKARRDATAPARRRIGEYLRHQAILAANYRRDTAEGVSDYTRRNAEEPKDVLSEVRTDEYANTARLRVSDLVKVMEPTVRDSKHEFYMQQATLLSGLDSDSLPDKQAALLPCIAKGHLSHHGSGSYSGKSGCTCARPDGRTVNALLNKDFIGIRKGLGYRPSGTLMLVRPKTT